jgi:tetratricopeptide (TPR) repeat protein
MRDFRKHLIWVSLASALCGPAAAQSPGDRSEKDLQTLYAELAQPGREDWQSVQQQIQRKWSQSGSDSMDLLLEQGNAALEEQDLNTALEYFSALVDHAPGFAEAWNARATTFFLMEEYALAIADVEHVLALNPHHFGALQGLAIMFEQMGQHALALDALRQVHAMNPNQPEVSASIERLERLEGLADL